MIDQVVRRCWPKYLSVRLTQVSDPIYFYYFFYTFEIDFCSYTATYQRDTIQNEQ